MMLANWDIQEPLNRQYRNSALCQVSNDLASAFFRVLEQRSKKTFVKNTRKETLYRVFYF
jgi:hypothetical protein